MEPVVLEGRHVRLEPMGLGHVDALSAVGLDEELWRWTLANVTTPEQMRAYVEEAPRWWEATASGRIRDSVYFSIIDREWPGVKARLEEKLERRPR